MLDKRTLEEKQTELARLLQGRGQGRTNPFPVSSNTQDAWQKAGRILVADELFSACQFALGVLQVMSTDQFAQGGDRCVRERLGDAIAIAQQVGLYRVGRGDDFQRCIEQSIRINAAIAL